MLCHHQHARQDRVELRSIAGCSDCIAVDRLCGKAYTNCYWSKAPRSRQSLRKCARNRITFIAATTLPPSAFDVLHPATWLPHLPCKNIFLSAQRGPQHLAAQQQTQPPSQDMPLTVHRHNVCITACKRNHTAYAANHRLHLTAHRKKTSSPSVCLASWQAPLASTGRSC